MNKYKFQAISGTDKDYVDAFEAMKAEGDFVYEKMKFDDLGEVGSEGLSMNKSILDIISQNVRVILSMTVYFPDNLQVGIQRQPEKDALFDQVTIDRLVHGNSQQQYNQPRHTLQFASLAATVQRHLGKSSSLIGVGNLLGPSVKEHFEAREIALARLETMGSKMLVEMEEARKRRDEEFRDREKRLEGRFHDKEKELEATVAQQKQELDQRAAELDDKSKELDDRAAKHARRQHYKDIKEKFKSWNETFQVTPGTSRLRGSVFWFTLFLLLLFGGLAGLFLFESVTAQDGLHLYPAIAKQITFTALFVTTAYFFIRWNNQWFQRHANEEFRLKRMELDIDRASWFVEMAFEWKDEKGEEIPEALIDRLTYGLFGEMGHDHAVEPAESIVHALLGAARLRVKLPGDIEAEYDRKEVKKLAKKEKQRQEAEEKKKSS